MDWPKPLVRKLRPTDNNYQQLKDGGHEWVVIVNPDKHGNEQGIGIATRSLSAAYKFTSRLVSRYKEGWRPRG